MCPARSDRRRKGYHFAGDLHAAAVERAESLLRSEGLSALSIKRIATELGVSAPALYRHFASRDDLVAHVAANGFAEMAARHNAAQDAVLGASPEDGVVQVARLYAKFAEERPHHYRIMFTGVLPEPTRFDRLRVVGTDAFTLLVGAIARLHAAQGRSDVNPVVDAAELWASLHGLCMLRLDDRLEFLDGLMGQERPAVDRLARRFVAGLRSPAGD